MQVKDIMTKDVKYIAPHVTLQEAAGIMREWNIGYLSVGENDQLMGVVTDRDITIRSVSKGANPATTTVEQAMTPKCLYCFEDDSIEETARNMAQSQVRRLPVMNKNKRLVGIVSLGDLCVKGSKQAAGDALEGIYQKDGK